MSGFPGSPRLIKGALVSIGKTSTPQVIAFQYNPQKLARTISPQWGERGGSGTLRLQGAAAQSIDLEIYLDATDDLERGQPVATTMGLAPQLAALETLLYPESSVVLANAASQRMGTIEVLPPSAPLTILIWGIQRIVPVRLESLSIQEESHDAQLNPLRARATLGLHVLTWSDLESTNPGFWLSVAHQKIQETLAAAATAGDLSTLLPTSFKLPRL